MNVVGNHYDKYGTRNPLARALMRGFLSAVGDLVHRARPVTVLEVGCGEGKLAKYVHGLIPGVERFEITDLDTSRIEPDLPPAIVVRQASVDQLPYPDGAFDLVLCCEVLEHLDDPAQALAEVARVADRHVILSTPWEPLWRVMNIARGHYLRDFGNTPGHVQHFTRKGLERLAEAHLHVIARRSPLPWTILLGRPRRAR